MPRPFCCRRIAGPPFCRMFKPAGIPASQLEAVTLSLDELEALRLADLEGLYQEQAAERMDVSRQTFGRIVESARKKVAQALINGLALIIEGGTVQMSSMRKFRCYACQHVWEVPYGTARPAQCPSCNDTNIHRHEEQRGPGAGQCPSPAAGPGAGAGMGRGCQRRRRRGAGNAA